MSLVGPRPPRARQPGGRIALLARRSALLAPPCRAARADGTWRRCVGTGARTRTSSDLQLRLESDLEYVRDWSILLDLWIIVATLRVVIHRNAY